jgi:hypothetical protein
MLTINSIYSSLCKNQVEIDKTYYSKINDFERNKDYVITEYILNKDELVLPYFLDIIFNKNISEFYYNNIFLNKTLLFTLFSSIFNIGDSIFNLFDDNVKEQIIIKFIKQMNNDLFKKGLFNKFKYNNHIDRIEFENILKNAESLKFSNNNIFKQYISDYLAINIYLLKIDNKQIDVDGCEYYLTKQFNNNINKFVPHFVILFEDNIYKPLLIHNKDTVYNSSILTYTEHKDIIDNIWVYLNINNVYIDNNIKNKPEKSKLKIVEQEVSEPKISEPEVIKIEISPKKYEYNFLKNLKIDFIKQLCNENSIELYKKSDKTSKNIHKFKKELIDELLLVC